MVTLQVDMVNKTATCGPGVRDIISKLPDGLLFPCGHCNGVPLGGYLKLLGGGFAWSPQKRLLLFCFRRIDLFLTDIIRLTDIFQYGYFVSRGNKSRLKTKYGIRSIAHGGIINLQSIKSQQSFE